MQTLRRNISCSRLLGGIEPPEVYALVVYFDARDPARAARLNASNPASVSLSQYPIVLQVLRLRYLAQVLQSVIVANAVHVVNLIWRPATVDPQPYQTVRQIQGIVNSGVDVPIARAATNARAKSAFSSGFRPRKQPCLRVITHKFTKSFSSQTHTHDNIIAAVGSQA